MNSSNPNKSVRKNENIVSMPVHQLKPYPKHPFKQYSDEKLDALAESIAREGLHQPIIVRVLNENREYEVLSGNNRILAMEKLRKKNIPAIIRRMDDAAAALVVVNTNLEQREKLLPSEKAYAYELRMEALQNAKSENSDTPSDGNGLGAQYQNDTDTHAQIFRYIRLTYLIPELLDLVDQDKIPVMAGYEASFLDVDTQDAVHHYFFGQDSKDQLSVKNAKTIRVANDAGRPVTT